MTDPLQARRRPGGWTGARHVRLATTVIVLTTASASSAQLAPVRPVNKATASSTISVSVSPPLTVKTVLPLDSGLVVGGAKLPETIAIPASDFGDGRPQPVYTNLSPSLLKTTAPATAAQIQISGGANQSYTVTFTGWVLKSKTSSITAAAASTAVSLYFAAPKYTVIGSSAKGTLDTHGQATVGIGSTITLTLPKGVSGEVCYNPQVTVAYN